MILKIAAAIRNRITTAVSFKRPTRKSDIEAAGNDYRHAAESRLHYCQDLTFAVE